MVLRNKSNTLFTIEFKLHDWRRAIRQAMDHSLGADKAYICLPKRKNNHYENIISEIIKYNIGLMIYDENSSQKVTILKDVDKSSHIEVYKNLLLEECDIIK